MRKRNVVVVGNCQASAIANLYRDFVGNPNLEAVTYFDDHMVPQERTQAAVADADLIIVQDRDFNHGIQAEQLGSGVEIIPFPMVLAGFLWPYANEPHVHNVPEPPFSDGPYPSQLSDSFLNRLIVKGVPPEEALDQYLALDVAQATHIDRMAEIYFDRQRERDARTGFDLAATIEASYRGEALFRTPHHPNARLFGVVASQLFERLGVPDEVIAAARQSLRTSPFPTDELPIHPGVISHLGLTFADDTTRYSYFDEGRFTFAEFVLRYMRYENNQPLRLGIHLADHGPAEEALAQLDQGLARSPASVRGWRARGMALARLGRHDEAVRSLEHAVAVDLHNPEGAIALSAVHRSNGNLTEAMTAAELAVAISPDYAGAQRALAEAAIALRDPRASTAAAAAVGLLPSSGNLHLQAIATVVVGDLVTAESAARRLLATEPHSVDARNLLAEVLEEQQRRPDAIGVLEEGRAAGLENGQTYSLLGNFHWRNGDLAVAEAMFEQGTRIDPNRPDLEQCRAQVHALRVAADGGSEVGALAVAAIAAAGEGADDPPPAAVPPAEAAPAALALATPRLAPPSRLRWLPSVDAWAARIRTIEALAEPTAEAWQALAALANTQLDALRTGRLDRSLLRLFGAEPPSGLATAPVRLAVLGSSTTDHLLPSIRVAALRRGIWVSILQANYGQYRQALLDPQSPLAAFAPTAVLLAIDARHLVQGAEAGLDATAAAALVDGVVADLRHLWAVARDRFRAQVIHQAPLPVFPDLFGLNEHRLPGSPSALAERLAARLREEADAAGVDLLALDRRAARDGLAAWHDPVLWHRAKQEVTPAAAPLYGDLVVRLLAARQGRSGKCLVLDLDNTTWGGVIGDDGVEGIALGQGSALGEAFADFQRYARSLARRGILLAACSKNDEANAVAGFEEHPEAVLRRADFAAFVANWHDKPGNLRQIAQMLNIGLDALVFADDNPFERALVRRELPEVAVPELPDDPALYAEWIADAGYFEGLALTEEDRVRTEMYRANQDRRAAEGQATDLDGYLRSLDMRLVWRRFAGPDVKRVAQLINKTNQFNLTTRRYTDEEVADLARDTRVLGLQFRLVDRFGDNGVIAVAIGRLDGAGALDLDSWLMSCRVLGRGVEQAMLAVVAGEASALGVATLVGRYLPTAKNGMVADLYTSIGFAAAGEPGVFRLAVDAAPAQDIIRIEEDRV